MSDTGCKLPITYGRRGVITISYDPDDRIESARAAAIVRGDTERLRAVLRDLRDSVRRHLRGKDDHIACLALDDIQAQGLLNWIDDELDGLPLSLED